MLRALFKKDPSSEVEFMIFYFLPVFITLHVGTLTKKISLGLFSTPMGKGHEEEEVVVSS